MLVLKGLGGLHRTVQLQLLQHYWSGHILEWSSGFSYFLQLKSEFGNKEFMI